MHACNHCDELYTNEMYTGAVGNLLHMKRAGMYSTAQRQLDTRIQSMGRAPTMIPIMCSYAGAGKFLPVMCSTPVTYAYVVQSLMHMSQDYPDFKTITRLLVGIFNYMYITTHAVVYNHMCFVFV